MSDAPSSDWALSDRFVWALKQLVQRDDRATLARLRRGVGKPFGSTAERDAWVLSNLPSSATDAEIEACCIIASLFGIGLTDSRQSVGSAFRLLAEKAGGDGPERRFVALLNSDAEELPDRLRHAVTLLKSKEISLDWSLLLGNLIRWKSDSRSVQRRWSRDFWGGREAAAAVQASQDSAT